MYHSLLNMKEPRYEYHFTQPYYRDWSSLYKGAGRVPFDHWLNQRRDPKEIQQEVVVKKLQKYHPFRSGLRFLFLIKFPGNQTCLSSPVGTRTPDGSTRT